MAPQVPAAERTLALLRELARQPRPVPASTLARELGLPRSTTYHLLAALVAAGFATHLPEEGRYGLGVAAFEVGSAYLRQDGLERLATPLLARLAARLGEVCHLGVLDGREVLYVARASAPSADVVVVEVGVRLPAHLTASGRVLLAWLAPAQLTALYPGGGALAHRTGGGPATRGALRRELAAVAERGWAHEDGEVVVGTASVAAPVHDHTGRVVAAVTTTFRRRAHPVGTWPALAGAVRSTAAELTARLHGRPEPGTVGRGRSA